MTEDHDFKQLVRARAAATGESYQAARRRLADSGGGFAATALVAFPRPAGLALGCIVEAGAVRPGMAVTVASNDPQRPPHRAVVVSLRHQWTDLDVVRFGAGPASGEFGMILDPPYLGPLPARVRG